MKLTKLLIYSWIILHLTTRWSGSMVVDFLEEKIDDGHITWNGER